MSHCQPNQVNLNFYQREKTSLTSVSIKSVDASLDQLAVLLLILKWRWREKMNKAELPAEVAECMKRGSCLQFQHLCLLILGFSPWESHSLPILKGMKGEVMKIYTSNPTLQWTHPSEPGQNPSLWYQGFILPRNVCIPGDNPVLWRRVLCMAVGWMVALKTCTHFPNSGAWNRTNL